MVILHIQTKGTQLSVSNQTLIIKSEEKSSEHQLSYVKAIHVYPNISMDTNFIRTCHDMHIDLIFCRDKGYGYAALGSPRIGTRANLVSKQLRLSQTPHARKLANDWLKLKEMRRCELLLPYAEKNRKSQSLFQKYKEEVDATTDFILHESQISKKYYQLLNAILPDELKFTKRSRRPALDITNALLNYGYGLLYPVVEKIIIRSNLDPHIGFHHGMAREGKAFLFDIIEMYRSWVEELLLIHQDVLRVYHFMDGHLELECRKYIIQSFYDRLYKEEESQLSFHDIMKKEINQIAKTINKLA